MESPNVIIYTDGSCMPNPGRGGCACVMLYKGHRKELSAGYTLSTNSRMEIMGAILALEAIKNPEIKIIINSDSQYLVNSFNKGWLFNWEKNKFQGRENADLWIKLLALYRKCSEVEFVWVRGHNGDTENERCDKLANKAAQNPTLKDIEYLKKVEKSNNG